MRCARVLVVVMAKVLGCDARLVGAITRCRDPGKLKRQHDQQQIDDDASHVASLAISLADERAADNYARGP